MQRTLSLLFILLLMIPGVYLFAQEEEPDPIEPEWIDIVSSPYAEGDRNFVITLGILFPTVFVGKEIENNNHGLSIGGTGSLAFNYFWTPNIFLGGEIGGSFSGTRARNMLYIIPFGGRIGYHFLYQRFEFPVTLMVGGAVQRYLERGYFGFIIKPGASVFWRYNPEWSFGFNAAWWFIPQWPTSGQDVYGNFLELTLSARYHF